jgi:hypothetical protein
MDALAQGYGTDSSEGSTNHHHTSTLGLLANYSNESDASDADEPTATTPKNRTATNEPSHDHIHLVKKPKLSKSNADTVGDEDAVSTCPGLPPPKLLSTVHKNSPSQAQPILFAKNYLQHKLTYNTSSTSTNSNSNSDLIEKLTRLAQNETSFAVQLKSQTEFGNPHIFHSIIDHFGIDPMESNIYSELNGNGHGNQKVPSEKETFVSEKPKQFENFEFLERLLVKEEENRVRQGSSA